MANTVIQLKKSSTPGSIPPDLEFGELGINYADGKLFYKNTNSQIAEISGQQINYFGTVNANGTIVVADTPGDIVSLIAGDSIEITADAINDTITITATAPPAPDLVAREAANAAFDAANNAGGGSYFQGNNGDVGSPAGLGDIFRVHTNVLTANVIIYSGNNALAAGPITINTNASLTIQSNARVAIV